MCRFARLREDWRGYRDSLGVLLWGYRGLILLIFSALKKMKRSGALNYFKVVTVLNIVVCGMVGGLTLLFLNVGWCNDYLNTDIHSNSFAVYWAKGLSNSPLFYRIGLFYLLCFTYGLGTMCWPFVAKL